MKGYLNAQLKTFSYMVSGNVSLSTCTGNAVRLCKKKDMFNYHYDNKITFNL